MAQTGFTPIQLYSSSTATNVPLAANLATGELAINITDGKLFYKDNANSVQVIGWKTTPTSAGGTGLTTYTAGDMVYYASGTTLSKLAIGATDYVMTSSGTAPQWSASLKATAGGTGQTSYAVGDLLYADTTTTLAKLADVATGNALISGGVSTAPSWGKIGLTTHISGVLPVANGGTGLTTITQNYLTYGNGTSAIGTSSKMQFDGTSLVVGTQAAISGGGFLQAGASSSDSAQSYVCTVNSASNFQDYIQFYNQNGTVGSVGRSGGTGVLYNVTSDPRLKNITGVVTPEAAENFVMALKPKTGTWIVDDSPFIGFLTTDYEKVDPVSVTGIAGAVDINGKPIYQQMEYGSAVWCANMTALVQSLVNRLKAANIP